MHAQPAFTPRTYGSPHGFGNVVFPGTGHAPGTFSPFSITDPTFGARLSNTVSGFGYGSVYQGYPGSYYYGGRLHYGQSTSTIVIPYAVPVYVPQPQVVPAPQVIYIVPGEPSRNLVTSGLQPGSEGSITYVAPSRSPATDTSGAPTKKLYLIAFKNHSIYSATDYWLENDTLHYLTTYGAHNQATLDQIDLEFTIQLNRERGIEFRLEK